MSDRTKIQYADSSMNLMSGCDGCELWVPVQGTKRCYAGNLTATYGGRKGWPVSFDQPTIFAERMQMLAKWKDLTGLDRPDKPWLNGYPRVVFLNDMGDTFTPSLPDNWLADYMPTLASLPHIFILLTKQPRRAARFFGDYGAIPSNLWLLTSITSRRNEGRAWDLLVLRDRFPRATIGVSLAPLWEPVILPWKDLDWVITEGESGPTTAIPSHPDWFRSARDNCAAAGVPYFHKQNGAWAHQSQVTADILALIDAGAEFGISQRHGWADGTVFFYTGRNGAGRLLDGIQHNGMPKVTLR